MTAPDITPRHSGGPELGGAERDLVQAAGVGRLVDLRVGDAGLDDPVDGASWAAERTVRAELLIELLAGERTADGGRLRAVKLRGASITGSLDLEAAELVCPVLLADCHFDEPVNLNEATAPAIRLPGCHLPGVTADQLRTTGNLELNRGFTAGGKVRLVGAKVGGTLDLGDATVINPGGHALVADGLTVAQDMICQNFTAEGEIRLPGARIGGVLSFIDGTLTNPGGYTLLGTSLAVGQSMVCWGLAATGEIRLQNALIRGVLSLAGATLTNPGGQALTADGLTVEQPMFCREGFTAEGQVSLTGAHIGGVADFSGARLTNPGGSALQADGLTVKQNMDCRDGFIAEGEIHLAGAHIGGVLCLDGAALSNPGRRALFALRLSADGGLHCRAGFSAQGELVLSGARIGGYLDLSESTLTKPGRQALDLEGMSATALILRHRQPPEGGVDLTNAQVGIFDDDPATWPATIGLRGFTYDSLGRQNDKVDVRVRLRWLARHRGGYVPQIYDQLASAYQRAGHEDAARKVAIAKQWRRRTMLNPIGKLTNWLLYLTVGYGYRTWQAALWLAGLLALGTWLFGHVHPDHMVKTGQQGPAFDALAYTLDVLLPIGDLGQHNTWQPEGAAVYWTWAFMAAGWVLTTAVIAGLTGILKRS